MTQKKLIKQVKDLVIQTEPSAKIILYGSRARGDAKENSDWDFLIILDSGNENISLQQEFSIRNTLYELELQTNNLISSMILSEKQWNNQLFHFSPFYQNVINEGRIL